MSAISIQAPVVRTVSTRLRITARGRRVLLALAATPLAVGIGLSALGGGSALATGESTAISFETVTVMPGDTLWSIAAEAAPGVDPRTVIDDIQRLNNLNSAAIQVGEEIAIPSLYAE